MVALYKQLKRRQCATIIHYAQPALLRVVDSLRHNHAFYALLFVNSSYNWVTIAAPIVNQYLQFEDSFKVHNQIHKKLNEIYVGENILCGMLLVFWRDFEGF